ncbi:mitogen-activated protein kinase kinase kinase 2 [Cucumis melo var. makuwa]|uniref:Mitogen-activated protein kinase kinase kinase 2 n=1 Tax=Cucumis melo var. makuwa TaxID=1194695 RepID=A0A5A7SIW7_CUCMM|nr:mitogen-activated protein kinase kinase kinase 2 [Cucumis melo var. makuwa]TYK23101.1 mitogen-activated protein kinase kinase kinase 2 [Cucumis melo var. makuwa]
MIPKHLRVLFNVYLSNSIQTFSLFRKGELHAVESKVHPVQLELNVVQSRDQAIHTGFYLKLFEVEVDVEHGDGSKMEVDDGHEDGWKVEVDAKHEDGQEMEVDTRHKDGWEVEVNIEHEDGWEVEVDARHEDGQREHYHLEEEQRGYLRNLL